METWTVSSSTREPQESLSTHLSRSSVAAGSSAALRVKTSQWRCVEQTLPDVSLTSKSTKVFCCFLQKKRKKSYPSYTLFLSVLLVLFLSLGTYCLPPYAPTPPFFALYTKKESLAVVQFECIQNYAEDFYFVLLCLTTRWSNGL